MKYESKYTLKELVKILEGLISCGEPYQEAMVAFLNVTTAMNAPNTAGYKGMETEE